MTHRFLVIAANAAVLIVTLMMSPMLRAQDSAGVASLRALYLEAVAQRGDFINRAMAFADQLLERQPHDPMASAYKGSLLTMMGGDAILPWNKLRYVNSGIDLMDEAIAGLDAPGYPEALQVETLMVCAFTNARLPAMFKRAVAARQQIDALVSHKAFATLEPRTQAQALAIAAAYAKADGDGAKSDGLLKLAAAQDESEAAKVFNERR